MAGTVPMRLTANGEQIGLPSYSQRLVKGLAICQTIKAQPADPDRSADAGMALARAVLSAGDAADMRAKMISRMTDPRARDAAW